MLGWVIEITIDAGSLLEREEVKVKSSVHRYLNCEAHNMCFTFLRDPRSYASDFVFAAQRMHQAD